MERKTRLMQYSDHMDAAERNVFASAVQLPLALMTPVVIAMDWYESIWMACLVISAVGLGRLLYGVWRYILAQRILDEGSI